MLTCAPSLTELISNPEFYGLCSYIIYFFWWSAVGTDLLIVLKVPAKDDNTGTEVLW